MVDSIELCKGNGEDNGFFSGLFSLGLLLEKEDKILPKRSADCVELSLDCSFPVLLKEKKEFKRLKMPNLSILISPKKEKFTKNNCKS